MSRNGWTISSKATRPASPSLLSEAFDEQPFAITEFVATADAVTANFDPNKKRRKFVLQTKIDRQKMGTSSNGRIEITITHPDNPSIYGSFQRSVEVPR